MLAPGVEIVQEEAPRGSGDALRADIVGFAGILERGPILVPRRVEDWGGFKLEFGGFLPIRGTQRQALTPLAAYAHFQNRGSTAYVLRWASTATRIGRAEVIDPATGATIGLTASSAGRWGNATRVSMPLRVRRRRSVSGFPTVAAGLREGDIVRFRRGVGTTPTFGRLVAGSGGLFAWPHSAVDPSVDLVEVIDPTVEVIVDSAAGRERHRDLSLAWESPRAVWRHFAPSPPQTEWTPDVPESWAPYAEDSEIALSLRQQRPGNSSLLRSALPDGYPTSFPPQTAPAPLPNPWSGTPSLEAIADVPEWRVQLTGGVDGTKAMDANVVLAAGRTMMTHPAPSIVTFPDLMLPAVPEPHDCSRRPVDDPRDEFPPEPAPPCAPRNETESAVSAPPPSIPSEDEPESQMPGFGPAIPALQRDLIAMSLPSSELGLDRGLDRTLLLDPLPMLTPAEVIASTDVMRSEVALAGHAGALPHCAMFHPWVRVLDPGMRGRRVILVPPSGHIVGLMAATTRDGTPGARFANITFEGAVGIAEVLPDRDRAALNAAHLGVVHAIPGRGVLVHGVRSLATWSRPDRFIPASRVVAYVRRVLRALGSTFVFEPNDADVRFRIHLTIDAVLDELWRKNALAGTTRAESYSVRVDDSTTTPAEQDLGMVVAEVEIAPAIPTEFILIRVAFSRDGSAVLDDIPGGA